MRGMWGESEGLTLIINERIRQFIDFDYDPNYDMSNNEDDELALAAICYATPVPLYTKNVCPATGSIEFSDPWPWCECKDDRLCNEDFDDEGYEITLLPKERYKRRVELLTKAGALIAAEIDRLLKTLEPLSEG